MRERIQYLDGLKGILIIFVIYYHILWAAVKFKESPTVDVFDTTCMQLFYMVSGYLLCLSGNWITTPFIRFAEKKAMAILLPTVLMFCLSIAYFELDLFYWSKSEFKNGYWFTYVLFFLYIVNYLVYKIQEKFNINKVKFEVALLVLAALASLFSFATHRILKFDIAYFLSLQFQFKYYLFFLVGYIWKSNQAKVNQILSYKWLTSLFLIISFSPTHLLGEGNIRTFCLFVVSVCRVVVIFHLFSSMKYFSSCDFLSKQVQKIGRHSLEIYFLHYYFIFGIPELYDILIGQKELYVVRGAGATFTIEALCIIPLCIIIAYMCIGVREITKVSPLSKYILGPIPKD